MMTAAMSSIIGWPVFGGARPGKPKKTVIRDAAGELVRIAHIVYRQFRFAGHGTVVVASLHEGQCCDESGDHDKM